MTHVPFVIQHWVGEKDMLTLLIAVCGLAIAAASAWIGLSTYRNSIVIKRVESLAQLHRSFFVDETYKKVRKQLDDDSEAGISSQRSLVSDEQREPDLVDFLNFFELVAYFAKLEAYKQEDIEAVLGYYLRIMKKPGPVNDYICESKHSFENLKALLGRLDP